MKVQLIKGKNFSVEVTNAGSNKRTLHLVKNEVYLSFNEEEIIQILNAFKYYELSEFKYEFKGIEYTLTEYGESKLDNLIDIEFERQFQNSEVENLAIEVSHLDVFEEFLNHYDTQEYIENKRKL